MTVQIEYLLNNEEKTQEIEAKDVATAIDIFEDAWQYAISKGYVKYLCAYEKKIDLYPDSIMRCVRQNLGYDPNDTNADKEISIMTPHEVFNSWLEWNGIIGYTDDIVYAVSNIYKENWRD